MEVKLFFTLIVFFFVFAKAQMPMYSRHKSSIVGILIENCDENIEALPDFVTNIVNSSSNEIPNHPLASGWTFTCQQYGQIANKMTEISASGVDRLVVTASREALLFIESMLSTRNAKSIGKLRTITSIATNNELTTGYTYTYTIGGRQSSNNQSSTLSSCGSRKRAGGRQFWSLVSNILLDVIDFWQWRNLYLYVDEVYGLAEARQIHMAFESYRKVASLKLIKTTNSMVIGDFLQQVSHFERGVREVKAVIIICRRQETMELVKQAAAMGLFSTFYRWLIFESGSQKLLENLQLQYDTDVVFMRHASNKTLSSSLFQAMTSNTIEQTNCSEKPLEVGHRNRDSLPLSLNLEFLRARRRVSQSPSLQTIGIWSATTGLANLTQELIADMDGVVLQIVALHCPPYVIVQKGKGGNMTFEGYLVDLMEALGKIMNFRYNISLPFDHTYGRCEDGICTGIIGFLVRKEADLALANLTPTGSRVELMDFSASPIDKGGLSILFRRPTKTDENIINAYFMPFSVPVSICVGVTIPVLGCLLYMVLLFGSKINDNVFEDESDEKDPIQAQHNRSLGRCLFAALQSFGQQGIDVIPSTGSGRAVFGVMWLFSLFVISAYTANLISYFTATFVSIPFRSFDDMFRSRKYKVGFMKGTTYLDDIQGENGSLLTEVWKQLEKQRFSTMVDDLDAGIERVRNERYIFVHEARVLEHIVSKDCEFTTMNERYLSAPMLLAFQKGSQFKRPISEMLLKMTESGLLEELKNKWWPPTMDCAIAAQTFQSISLWGVTSIMSVLAGGLFIGACIMLLERCIKAQKQRALRLRSTIAASSSHVLGQLQVTERISLPASLRLTSPGRFREVSPDVEQSVVDDIKESQVLEDHPEPTALNSTTNTDADGNQIIVN